MQRSQQSSSSPGVVSSAQDGQAPRGTPEGRKHPALQLLQLQRAPTPGPVPSSHAQQAVGRVQRHRPAQRQQTRHVLRQRPAGPAKAQTAPRAGEKEQRPFVFVSGT